MESLPKVINNRIFIGRAEEVAALTGLYKSYLEGNASVVVVTGEPGIGKTFLVEHFFRKRLDCHYVYGKHGQFSDIGSVSQIIEQLTNYALTLSKGSLGKIQVELEKAIGNDISLLYKINPSISQILKQEIQSANNDLMKTKYRVKNAVFKYIAAIAEYCFPMVIYVDDLQWADALSIEIIKTLVKKIENSGIMLVLSYRSNEPVMVVDHLKPALQGKSFWVALKKFSHAEIIEYIGVVLPGTIIAVDEFAKHIYSNTQGNPFYIEKLLRILLHDKIIKRDGDTWDISAALSSHYLRGTSAESVISDSIWNHYHQDKFIFDIISCFQDVDLELIEQIAGTDINETSNLIQSLVDASILTTNQTRNKVTVTYSHDIIGKLVYGNISCEQKENIHYFIANNIMQKMKQSERLDDIIVSHLLNSSPQKIAADAERWIDILFDSGMRKKMIAQVEQARQIFALCIVILPHCPSKDHRFKAEVKLECAECLCLLDRAGEAHDVIQSLLQSNTDSSIIASIKLQQLSIYHYQRQHSSVIASGKSLLKEMGLTVNRVQMPLNLLTLKRLYSKKWIESMIRLPVIADVRLLKTLDVLTLMTICATLSDDDMSACLCLKAAVYCGKYANSPNSIIGHVAGAYIMLTVWKDTRRAFLLEDAIIELLEHADNRNKAFAYFILGTFFSLFSKSLTESEECLKKAIRYGETTGDFVFLGYSILSSLDNKAFVGSHLDEMLKCINQIRADYGDLEQNNIAYNLQVHEAHILALKLGSDCFDENHISRGYEQLTPFEKFTEKGLMLQRMFLFGETKKAYELAEKLTADVKLLDGMISSIDIHLYMALIRINYHKQLKKNDKNRNLVKIKCIMRMAKNWSELNNKDFGPVYALILAEYEARIHEKPIADSLYNNAIDSCANNSKLLALAVLLYARNCRNKSVSVHLANESAKLHRNWGAVAIADYIEKEFFGEQRGQNVQHKNEVKMQLLLAELGKECETLDEGDTIEKFINVIIKTGYADHCAFLYEKPDLIAIGMESKDGRVKRYENGKSLENSNSVSTYISRHSYRTCKEIYHHPDGAKTIYSSDSYIVKHPDRYIVCIPVFCHGIIAGLIYMEKKDQGFDANTTALIKNFLPIIASKITTIKGVNLFNILSDKTANTNLSKRELDVLNLMVRGYSNQQISAGLNIAAGTVKNHISNILTKLETDSRTKAVYIAQERNLI